jgi:hypothetical protein
MNKRYVYHMTGIYQVVGRRAGLLGDDLRLRPVGVRGENRWVAE